MVSRVVGLGKRNKRKKTPSRCRSSIDTIDPVREHLRLAHRLARERIARLARFAVAVAFAPDQRISAREQRIAFQHQRAAALFLVVRNRTQSVHATRGR